MSPTISQTISANILYIDNTWINLMSYAARSNNWPEITYEQFGKQNRLKPRIRCADDVWANSKLTEVIRICNNYSRQSVSCPMGQNQTCWKRFAKNRWISRRSQNESLTRYTSKRMFARRTDIPREPRTAFGGRHFKRDDRKWPEHDGRDRSPLKRVTKMIIRAWIRAHVTRCMCSVDHGVATNGNVLPNMIIGRGLREKIVVSVGNGNGKVGEW